MKKITLILVGLLFFSSVSFAQNDKITKYCGFSAGFGRLKIGFGRVDSLFSFKDSTIRKNLEKVHDFKSSIDGLNYMTSLGWTLVGMTNNGTQSTVIFYFKKEFDQSELSDK